ncbi:hypothetical protein GCM10022245_36770 [Streptomyces mayteni]
MMYITPMGSLACCSGWGWVALDSRAGVVFSQVSEVPADSGRRPGVAGGHGPLGGSVDLR